VGQRVAIREEWVIRNAQCASLVVRTMSIEKAMPTKFSHVAGRTCTLQLTRKHIVLFLSTAMNGTAQ
jgi:hypothetical protein